MNIVVKCIKMFLVLTVITGVIYPLLITAFAQIAFHRKAEGSFIAKGGIVVGSELIGQKFENPKYFWGRPSAVDYNPLPSGGSNLGPTSQALKEAVAQRKAALGGENPPAELLFASGSGLDPHISPATAEFQLKRVASARGLKEEDVQKLIQQNTEGRLLGFIGESRLNVLKLNLALDKLGN